MKERNEEQNRTDPNLDIPSEANRTKHINFLDIEEDNSSAGRNKDDFSEERKKQWEEGLKEGTEKRRE